MKKASKSAKQPPKKAVAKKAVARKAMAGGGTLGCCTVTGIGGPNKQFEHVTQAKCQEIADGLGGNPHWVPGECAKSG
jgi:hypothetical protein